MIQSRALLLAIALIFFPAGLGAPLHAQPEGEVPPPVSREQLEQHTRGYSRERIGVPMTPPPAELADVRGETVMELRALESPTAGEEATLEFTLRNAGGLPLGAADMASVRGRGMELHLIDQALDDYHVLAPREQDEPGTFRATFTPMNGGEYTAFLLARPGTTHLLEIPAATIQVAGSTGARRSDPRLEAVAGGHSFALEFRGTPRAERLLRGNLTVRNARGEIANEELQPLGEDRITILAVSQHRNRAFLAGFPYYETAAAGARGPIPFTLMVDHPGVWHLFVRAQAGERELHVPLIVHISAARENETNEEAFAELDRIMAGVDQLRRTGRLREIADVVEPMKRQFAVLVNNLGELPEPNQTAIPAALFRLEQSLGHTRRFGLANNAAQFRAAQTQLQRDMNALRQAAMVPPAPELQSAGGSECPYTGEPVGSHHLGAHVAHRDRRVDFSSFTAAALFAQDPDHHIDAVMMGQATED